MTSNRHDTQRALNDQALADPRVGDMWTDHLVKVCLVIKTVRDVVYYVRTKLTPDGGLYWDYTSVRVTTKDGFAKWLSYGQIPGTWGEVQRGLYLHDVPSESEWSFVTAVETHEPVLLDHNPVVIETPRGVGTGILSDKEIAVLSVGPTPMIEPFIGCQVKEEGGVKVLSYGLSSYGYDLRVGRKWKIFSNALASVIDPKDFDSKSFVDFEGDVCIVPPNSFVLAHSHERIRMPRDVTGVVLAKSTYARTGLSCLATPLEAGWEGYVTLEFANTTPLPIKIYAMEGSCQVLFFRGNQPPMVSYADRGGKYQGQEAAPVVPKV